MDRGNLHVQIGRSRIRASMKWTLVLFLPMDHTNGKQRSDIDPNEQITSNGRHTLTHKKFRIRHPRVAVLIENDQSCLRLWIPKELAPRRPDNGPSQRADLRQAPDYVVDCMPKQTAFMTIVF